MTILLSIPGNNQCADCGEKDPQWAAANHGVFVCIVCSGAHRNLGVHISRVKSLFLDNWKRDELEVMKDHGNTIAAKQWECNFPKYFTKPLPTNSTTLKESYIRAKYERKEYSAEFKRESTLQKIAYKEGYLTKQGIVVKNWKRRFVVQLGTVVQYFKKQKDPVAAGDILLKDATKIDCLEAIDGKSFCFSVVTPTREFFVSCDNVKDLYEWVQLLRGAQAVLCANKPDGKKAADVNTKDFVSKLTSELMPQKRKVNKKVYSNCFSGVNVVDWMMNCLDMANRTECVALGKKLVDEGIIQSCTGPSQPFADSGDLLFQFVTKTPQ